MPRSIKVEVNIEVFKWLREISGWSIKDVSKRLRTSVEAIESIESGERPPTLWQLRTLAKAYKRPLASFFLPEPLPQPPMPKDYRMIPGREGVYDKRTIYAIRRARSLQKIGHDLSRNIDYGTRPDVEQLTIRRDPEGVAAEYRTRFELTEERQRSFRTPYELFNYLRDLLEDLNVLVFQFSMPVEDARGFALTDEKPNIIVINTRDSIEARLFSLMHEFGHILLGETVIDIPDISTRTQNRIERWCNTFASRFLLPRDTAMELFSSEGSGLTDTDALRSFSNRYKVSKAMLLYNMLKLDFIDQDEYENTLDRYRPSVDEGDEGDRSKKGGWGMTGDKRCLSEVGNKFVSIVANNFDREHITFNDALNYLSIRSKHFDRVLSKARK